MPCVTTTSMIRRNMYDIKILWLIGFIFELRIGLVFQNTQLQIRSWCTKSICIFCQKCTEKVHLSEDFNNLWLISDFCQKKCGFSKFFMIFHCYNLTFLPNLAKSYSKMQFVDNKFILYPKSTTVLIWCQIFAVKECFFIIR